MNHHEAEKYNTENGDIREIFTDSIKAFFYFRNILMFTQYMSKFNCIYAHKKIMAFPEQIFTNLVTAQQHYVQLPYTFHPNVTINFGSTNMDSFTSLK